MTTTDDPIAAWLEQTLGRRMSDADWNVTQRARGRVCKEHERVFDSNYGRDCSVCLALGRPERKYMADGTMHAEGSQP